MQVALLITRHRLEVDFVEYKSGGECADDRREAKQVRRPCEQQTERDGEGEQHTAHLEATHATQQTRHNVLPQRNRAEQKDHSLKRDAEHRQFRDARACCRDAARDHRQHDETQHVVHHRRAENDARLARL